MEQGRTAPKTSVPETPVPKRAALSAPTRASAITSRLESGAIWVAEGAPSSFPLSPAPSLAGADYMASYVNIAPFGEPQIDSELPDGGLSSGALHEWFGISNAEPSPASYKTYFQEALPPLTLISVLTGNALENSFKQVGSLKRASSSKEQILKSWNRYILWIGKECWPSPYLLQKTLPFPELLAACLFIDVASEEDRLWAIDTALRSEASFATIAYLPKLTISQSKRFSIALEKSNRFAFLLRPPEARSKPTTSATRWEARPYKAPTASPEAPPLPAWHLSLTKQKGKQSLKRNWVVQLDEEFFSHEQYRITTRQEGIQQEDISIRDSHDGDLSAGMVSESSGTLTQAAHPYRANERRTGRGSHKKVFSQTG